MVNVTRAAWCQEIHIPVLLCCWLLKINENKIRLLLIKKCHSESENVTLNSKKSFLGIQKCHSKYEKVTLSFLYFFFFLSFNMRTPFSFCSSFVFCSHVHVLHLPIRHLFKCLWPHCPKWKHIPLNNYLILFNCIPPPFLILLRHNKQRTKSLNDELMNGLYWFLPISWICFYSFFLIIYSVSCCFMDEFSDDKFETLWLFMICIFILLLRIAGIVELGLLTSLKKIMFQLTEIEWCFEMFYFFSFRS